MKNDIHSVWQDYESHLFTCKHCNTETLGSNLIHDFDASELVMPLECPACEKRVALLNIQATRDEIKAFAAQGYKTAIDHLENPDRYYETWPDFTAGEDANDAASRIAHSMALMADPKLGSDAVQFMLMVAFGIKQATSETPYIVESETDDSQYYQVIRGANGQYYSELSSPESADESADKVQRAAMEKHGWIVPNEDSPNFHQEYDAKADVYEIAAAATKAWFKTTR